MMLTRETFIGPWAGLPVAWTDDNQVDEDAYSRDVANCCKAAVPGVYTGGTSGEFYAMEFDEFKQVARVTVAQCRAAGTPCMIGCTSTYTLGVIRRVEFAAELGASAVQVAMPFWMELADHEVVPFFGEVARAAGEMALSIYETERAKKVLTLDQHRAIKDVAPNYMMVKANIETLGQTHEGCKVLSEFVNVFVTESELASLGPFGASGSCSAVVYYNPRVMLGIWANLKEKNWDALREDCKRLETLLNFFVERFGDRGFTDTGFDRLGGMTGGFLNCGLRGRKPYSSATPEDVDILKAWYREHWPDMLEQ